MEIRKVHLLFEQSGTFKKAFRNLGISAEDYDIQNEFGETDNVVDLFEEIERAFDGKTSIFDTFDKKDLLFAFFPCIRFENQIMLHFRGQGFAQQSWSDEDKMLYDLKLLEEVKQMYELVNKMFIVCVRGGYRLIMENPYSEEHFLRRYWCIQPTIIDRDRRENGDYFKKPTQYWFLNCRPESNVLFEPLPLNAIEGRDLFRYMSKEQMEETGASSVKTARSMIHPDYADRFIRQYIVGGENEHIKSNNGITGNNPG